MVLIEDEVLQSAKISEQDLRTELALLFYQQQRLSFGQARKLAGLNYLEFEQLLFARGIPRFNVEALADDLATLNYLKNR
jgi:predicted HTH domain antitoxin